MTPRFRLDHLGVAVADLEEAIDSYERLFGCSLLEGPFDDPTQEARVAFLTFAAEEGTLDAAGLARLELVAPLDAASHVTRILERGLGAYHVCYEVEELEETLAELRGQGCLVLRAPAPAVAYGGRRIAWFYTPTRQLVELVESAAEAP